MIPEVHDLDGLELIDLAYAGLGGVMGSYLLRGDSGRFMLIETGPLTALGQLEAGIRSAGLEPENLTDVLVTHIHLDHAGSTGSLARRYGATVHVHEGGAQHLLDPARLVASSRRAYGAEAFTELMGGLESVPSGLLRSFGDDADFRLHGRRIRVLPTPGHAGSHVAFLVDGVGLFAGDAAAIRLAGPAYAKPATAPPEIDLEAWDDSLQRLRAVRADRLLLTHFGAYTDVDAHLDRVAGQNRLWAEEIRSGLEKGEGHEQLVGRISRLAERQMAEAGIPESVRAGYRVSSDYNMTAAGLARYWSKRP
jgi:glyoxylase-like metal-dependent hydrolase (beta-lactamase superfamily II)